MEQDDRSPAEHRGGRTAPTSKDVAALAGVAQSTVSAVMSGKRAVSAETRRRVEAAMRQLRYQPNAGARTLRTAKTNVIALVMHLSAKVDAAESVPYLDTIIEQARQHDYDVLVSTEREAPEGIRRLAGRSICDAFVLMDIQPDDERIDAAHDLGLPVVLVGRPKDPRGLDVVDFDIRRSAELMVDELALTGHRHIAVLGDLPAERRRFQFMFDFYDGLRDRAAAHGVELTVVPRRLEGWEGVVDSADRLLAHADDRLGLICRAPQVTEWLVRLVHERHLLLGEDLSLVSLCTDETALSFARPVTNVSPLPRTVSSLAMRLLLERLEGSRAPARLELVEPRGLTRRATTTLFNAPG
ncbi:LacI family DNA-binding transcriptional regulator [Streptomyces sp. NPDC003247]|uniref:LacI family DNA-binding transcriptional regulator n=1 Tax=Streptomyces sp. NPDC003247 TaxID=3364677 RepID=UPI0036C35001